MWKLNLPGIKLHGGSTRHPFHKKDAVPHPLAYGCYRSRHFAFESAWFYLHLRASQTVHPDESPVIEAYGGSYRAYELTARGLPHKYHGNIGTGLTFRLGERFSASYNTDYDYGQKTSDWQAIENGIHKRRHPEEAE